MKTIVVEKHPKTDNPRLDATTCQTRWASPDRLCSGVETAAWLNSLGEDEEQYTKFVTNGQVRKNWLAWYGSHIELAPGLEKVSCSHCHGNGYITRERNAS